VGSSGSSSPPLLEPSRLQVAAPQGSDRSGCYDGTSGRKSSAGVCTRPVRLRDRARVRRRAAPSGSRTVAMEVGPLGVDWVRATARRRSRGRRASPVLPRRAARVSIPDPGARPGGVSRKVTASRRRSPHMTSIAGEATRAALGSPAQGVGLAPCVQYPYFCALPCTLVGAQEVGAGQHGNLRQALMPNRLCRPVPKTTACLRRPGWGSDGSKPHLPSAGLA
jgi:hypothetical protein